MSQLLHDGPFAGSRPERLPPEAMDTGRWEVREGRWQGAYVRDEGSAGGRDWDWEEDD